MAEEQKNRTLVQKGDKSKWITPSCLTELLQLKSQYPYAPLVIGNTFIGPPVNLIGSFYPIIISPARVSELSIVNFAETGITIGAACSLAMVRSILSEAVSQVPDSKSKIFIVIIQQLSGSHIRSEASLGGSILSGSSTWDLNPILAVGNCTFNLASKDRKRQVTLRQLIFDETGNSALCPDEILISVNVPFTKEWDFVSGFRQVQRWGSTAPADIAAMRVILREGTDLIMSMNIYYGGSEAACMFAKHVSDTLVGRRWNESMLDEACKLFLEEVPIQEAVFGDMVEYERTLAISFLFQFYLQVSNELKAMNFPHTDTFEPRLTHTTISNNSSKELHPRTSNGVHSNSIEDMNHRYEDETDAAANFQPHSLQTIEEEEFADEDTSILDGELFLALVTSNRHHAKIISINTEDALKVPGVVDVITSADVPGIANSNLFAQSEVNYIGQAICAVVANTQNHANVGASKVRVEYEDLEPVVLSIQDSVKHNSFFKPVRKLEYGNVDEAFSNVDYTLEGEDYIDGQNELPASQAVRVIPREEDNEMEVFISTMDPASIQAEVASALNIPSDYILCCVEKWQGIDHSHTASQAAITAVAAHKTGQAVTSVIQQRDKSPILRHQPPFLGKYKIGYMGDGRVVALDVTYYCNAGHRPDESFKILTTALLSAQNAYSIPNTRCSVVACKTNCAAKTFCSGYGFAQAAMLAEVWMDTVADRCGMPPEKVRHLNLHRRNGEVQPKQASDADRLLGCWNECLERSHYRQRRAAADERNKDYKWKKIGFSIIPAMFPTGIIADFLCQASVLVHICADGWVLLTPTGSDLEQESLTKMMQVVSREFRVPLSYIRISEASTAFGTENDVRLSSYDTQVHIMAVQEACQTILQRLQPIICLNPNASWKECIQEAFRLRICLSATAHYRAPDEISDWELEADAQNSDFVFAAACSEVELDCRTGNHKSIRADVVIDVGSIVNEALIIDQVRNAFSQGLGLYTNEDLKYLVYSSSSNGVQSSQAAASSSKSVLENISVTLLPSLSSNIGCCPKVVEEVSLFLGSSVFFAIKNAILAARQHIGLPGTILLPVPARPQHIRMACGNYLIEAEQTSDKSDFNFSNHVSET
ncbi:aldehyde oxidase-like [Hyperolius riggenbachi]|uniref:aldehyde oxidase-like n=1 Tax=Hyperolius riggenbachi TaxID=752182 RepID=UPI0035A2B4DD